MLLVLPSFGVVAARSLFAHICVAIVGVGVVVASILVVIAVIAMPCRFFAAVVGVGVVVVAPVVDIFADSALPGRLLAVDGALVFAYHASAALPGVLDVFLGNASAPIFFVRRLLFATAPAAFTAGVLTEFSIA